MDVETIASVLGLLGLGSILTQYVSGGSQRRQARSEVLRALSRAESSRWEGPSDHPVFGDSMRELEVAAPIARLPQVTISHYILLASVGRSISAQRWEEEGDPEFGGAIPSDLADLVTDAACDVAKLAWHPFTGRWNLIDRVRRRDKALVALAGQPDENGYRQRAAIARTPEQVLQVLGYKTP